MEILYQDNHIIVVNKRVGELVQPDPSGAPALEQAVKEYLRVENNKPGEAFLGVVHRIDRPVSGVVLFAKTSKALVRLNEQLRDGGFEKIYLAVVEKTPPEQQGTLSGYIRRNTKINKSVVTDKPSVDAKQAELRYQLIGATDNYFLLQIQLLTGRHHQIRAQLSAAGCPIKGDLKYGARRSNPDGGICLHSYSLGFIHPVTKERLTITAPVPSNDNLWATFGNLANNV